MSGKKVTAPEIQGWYEGKLFNNNNNGVGYTSRESEEFFLEG